MANPIMRLYQFDPDGVLINVADIVYPEGQEPEVGKYATKVEPPKYGEHQIPKWDGSSWMVVPDWRHVPMYHFDGSQGATIDHAGVTPEEVGLTPVKPPEGIVKWDGSKWVPDDERIHQNAISVWTYQRDVAISKVSKAIQIHQDEEIVADSLTITPELYRALVAYRLVLNKIKELEPIPPMPVGVENVCSSLS